MLIVDELKRIEAEDTVLLIYNDSDHTRNHLESVENHRNHSESLESIENHRNHLESCGNLESFVESLGILESSGILA